VGLDPGPVFFIALPGEITLKVVSSSTFKNNLFHSFFDSDCENSFATFTKISLLLSLNPEFLKSDNDEGSDICKGIDKKSTAVGLIHKPLSSNVNSNLS